ncbi:MAG: response regulator [Lachnospiraceae bacterium]|nr:response regulator [Lachnospiraceae bacterium]
MSDKLKIVVIDDDKERIELIRDLLPDYMDVITGDYGEGAKAVIRPTDGRDTDLIIMNADDKRGRSLYMFDWMKSESGLDRIPVILLVDDEFSDRVMSFLEIADAEFYEGQIDPDEFFMLVTGVINDAEMGPELPEEPVYLEKDPTRIQGLSVKPVGEGEGTVRRSIVLRHDDQLKQLDLALERGRKKQEKLREIMAYALQYKEKKNLRKQEAVAERAEPEPSAATLHRLKRSDVARMLEDEETEDLRTVVIVDDDRKNRRLCELFLRSSYRVVCFASGMSAIDYFVKNRADLLLLSYRMPVLDGVKVLESIRWQPNGKKVPVIFMAEGDIEAAREKCRKERVVGMLAKPVQKAALRRAVNAVLMTLK